MVPFSSRHPQLPLLYHHCRTFLSTRRITVPLAALLTALVLFCLMRWQGPKGPTPSELWLASAKALQIPSHGTGSVAEGQRRPRVVVSLSTFSARILRVDSALESLLRQTLMPDQIYLAIPDSVKRLNVSSFPEVSSAESADSSLAKQSMPPGSSEAANGPPHLPAQIQQIVDKSEGRIKVLHTKDYGPSTKLLPALLQEPDPETIIITADDDVWYHGDTVAALVASIQALQDLATNGSSQEDHVAGRARRDGPVAKGTLGEGTSGRGAHGEATPGELMTGHAPCWYCEEWYFGSANKKTKEGVCNGWLGAFAGAAYYRKWFDDAVFEYDGAPDGCRLHDDVWISGNLMRKGIRPYVIRPGFNSVVYHLPYTSLSIHSVKHTEGMYRDPCIRHFGWFRG